MTAAARTSSGPNWRRMPLAAKPHSTSRYSADATRLNSVWSTSRCVFFRFWFCEYDSGTSRTTEQRSGMKPTP